MKIKGRGRPTKYKEEFCQEMIGFFDQEPYEDVKLPHFKDGNIKWTDIKRMPRKLPTMVEFVKHLNKKIKKKKDRVGYRTIYDWIDEKHPSYQKEFSQTYTRICKPLQENFLNQNGLQGLYNPTFAKFVAINITDMIDRKELEHSGSIDLGLAEKMQKARKRTGKCPKQKR